MKNITINILLIISFMYISYCDTKCRYMKNAFDPLDCFSLGFSSSKTEKCCLLEYKSKEKDRKFRHCIEISLEQFIDIDGTIKDLENKDDDIKITSLECDKSSKLIFSTFFIIYLYALLLF